MKRITHEDWPINHDKPLLPYPERFVNSVNTDDAELMGARWTSGIRMAKNATTWRKRITPSRLGSNLTTTVLTKKVRRRTAYMMSVACHRLGS